MAKIMRLSRVKSKKDKRSEDEVFAEAAKLNPRLSRAVTDATDAVGFYSARIAEVLEQLKPSQTMRKNTLREQLGLVDLPDGGCERSVREEVIANERQWYELALNALEEGDLIMIGRKGRSTHVRLATDKDRERHRREEAEDAEREAEQKRVREALGRNPAYVAARKGTIRQRNAGPRVTFVGPAYRKLVKLLEREGLLKNE